MVSTTTSPSFVEEWIAGPDNHKFFTRRYNAQNIPEGGQPKGLIVFCHGFQEHIARYEHVFPVWASHGYTVFAFDQRGFGRTACDEANRSPDARYAWTSRPQQLGDLEFFLNKEADALPPTVPVFLYGHSMGGALVLSFATATHAPPSAKTISRLAGVISSSPLIHQANPAPKLLKVLLGYLAPVFPTLRFPADAPPPDLSTDQEVGRKAREDPMMKNFGTLRCLADIIDAGDKLAAVEYNHWPINLPLLIVHGDGDKVCSHPTSKKFVDDCPAKDKGHITYPGSYHEIHNEPSHFDKLLADSTAWFDNHLHAKL